MWDHGPPLFHHGQPGYMARAYPRGLQTEVGNDCNYEVTVDDKTIASGTCTEGGMVRDATRSGNPPTGAGDLDLGRDTNVVDTDDHERFILQMTLPDAQSWTHTPVHYALSDGNIMNIRVSYQRAAKGLQGLQAAKDARWIAFGCEVKIDGELDDGTKKLELDVDSAEEICLFVGEPQYLVHGRVDAECEGYLGPVDDPSSSKTAKFHVTF